MNPNRECRVHPSDGATACHDARRRVARRILAATSAWAAGASLADIRAGFESLLSYPGAVEPACFEIDGMPAVWIDPPSTFDGDVMMFCHGGGFQIGSIRSHLDLMARLALAAQVRVLGFEYRLAPEHRFPVAPEDCLRVYHWLLDHAVLPGRIAVAGDSAGGNLALGVALQARDRGLPLPSCLVLISPWLDLTMRGSSYATRAERDIFSKLPQLKAMARTYLGRGGDPHHPLASPLDADLRGLPPILVHAGDSDITVDDSHLLARRAAEAGVRVELKVWPDMYHHFQVFRELPEAQESIAEIAAFVRAHLVAAGGT
jgi:epsilon-lactone hydrolase